MVRGLEVWSFDQLPKRHNLTHPPTLYQQYKFFYMINHHKQTTDQFCSCQFIGLFCTPDYTAAEHPINRRRIF